MTALCARGCGREVYALGLCRTTYRRELRNRPNGPPDHRDLTYTEAAELTLHPKNRACPECGTILQRRNPGPNCHRHTAPLPLTDEQIDDLFDDYANDYD